MIPFLSALHIPDDHLYSEYALPIGTALLGVLITILEGVLHLYQFQQVWITSRATAEAMIREKYMYLAKGGDYGRAADPLALLAERIETIG